MKDAIARLATMQARFPLVRDFARAFDQALEGWRLAVSQRFGVHNVEELEADLLCVRLPEPSAALQLLRIHADLMAEHFPRLLDVQPCPVRLGVSLSPAKHPFFAHWRHIERPAEEVAVHLAPGGRALLRARCLPQVLDLIGDARRGALHRLTRIARTSEALARLVLKDGADRDVQSYRRLRDISPLGLDFPSLLALANLAGADIHQG